MWRSLVLVTVLGTSARADENVPVEMEAMTVLPADIDVCSVEGFDECRVLTTEKIFRLGRASVVERLEDGATRLDLVVDTTEGRWTIQAIQLMEDCGMHHCVATTLTSGPTLRPVTIGGRPSMLFEARQTAEHTATDPDTGKGSPASHESTSLFLACTRTKSNDPGWTCMRGSFNADHCTLSISRAGKMRTSCSSELTFDQPTD
jgi:hypothetical protein